MTQRPLCPQCQRPLRRCLCACVRPVAHATELLILQHPLEQHEAKGTAGLLRLCLQPRCRVEVGEVFDAALLQGWLGDAGSWLLYPPDEQAPAAPADGQPPLRRLVVLDATWRKSRKMLALNPALQALPRLALRDLPASRYAIRKAHAPHQLSTLEAVALALVQIEQAPSIAAALTQALDAFVAQQQALLRS